MFYRIYDRLSEIAEDNLTIYYEQIRNAQYMQTPSLWESFELTVGMHPVKRLEFHVNRLETHPATYAFDGHTEAIVSQTQTVNSQHSESRIYTYHSAGPIQVTASNEVWSADITYSR